MATLADTLRGEVVRACLRRPRCLASLIDTMRREEPVASTSAMVFMRHLLASEDNRAKTFKAGIPVALLTMCEESAADSLAFVLGLHSLIAFAFPSARGPSEVRTTLRFRCPPPAPPRCLPHFLLLPPPPPPSVSHRCKRSRPFRGLVG